MTMKWLTAFALVLLIGGTLIATNQIDAERYGGSFRLDTGEVVTGGVFVERAGDPERFVYMDTATRIKGGLFERVDDQLQAVGAPGGATIEFLPGTDRRSDRIRWREPGQPVAEGVRIAPHIVQSVRIPTSDGQTLNGRLLIPDCRGSHPLVVLVGGSGPSTKYGGPFETFFVQLGMAVLTYDKRGVGTPGWTEPDLSVLAADAAAALQFGSRLDIVDARRAGLWGSSQGGWVAPMAAATTSAAFLIVRAGPGVSEGETNLHEVRQELRQDGMTGLDLDAAVELRRAIYALAIEGLPIAAADALAEPYLNEAWYRTAFGNGPISSLWTPVRWRWATKNLAITAVPSLRRYRGPVLWFLAERDENVPLVPSRTALARVFAERAPAAGELVVLEGANHAFFIDQGGAQRYTAGYWDRIAQWLAQRGLSEPGCWAA